MVSVLVLGGTGFVGCHLCNLLNSEGMEVFAGSPRPNREVFPLDNGVEKVKVDILDSEDLDFEGFDVVVNLVGLTPLREPSGVSYNDIHVDGVRNVVEEFNSSSADFLVHMSALGADSSSRIDYIRTKGVGEDFVRSNTDDFAVLRPSVIFGEGGEFLDSIAEDPGKGPILPLPLNGETRFQPVFIGDLVEGISRILEDRDMYRGEVFEFGGPEVLSYREIAEKVFDEKDGFKPFFIPVPGFAVFSGLAVSEHLPFIPMGLDQYRSLKIDNVVKGEDGFAKLGINDLTDLSGYLRDSV